VTDPAPSLRTISALIVLAIALLAVALSRLTLTYDLGFFLPPPTTDAQRVLVERLGQGPGTQLVFVVLPNTGDVTSKAIAARLRELDGITRVLPQARALGIESLPRAVWNHRLLLSDLPQSVDDWQDTLDERSMDAMLADDNMLDLIAADPTLSSIEAVEAASATTGKPSFANNNERYLLIQTSDAAFDIDAQQNTVAAIRATLADFGQRTAKLYGSGVYGVDMQAFVQRESVIFSALASLALITLILFRFRNLATALAVGTPLLVGGTAGLCALSLTFDAIHGITLAFGFTLLGVAIDYPLHLFSHRRVNTEHSIWPTLSLGIASTLIAYLAFIASGTPGMQQLGVFATAGILGAAGAAFLLNRRQPAVPQKATTSPAVLSSAETRQNATMPPNQLLWIVCLATCAIALYKQPLFSNNLSDLTPVPAATLAEDSRLRKTIGVADLRYLISVNHKDPNRVLRELEQVTKALDQSILAGDLASYQSVTSLLPSAEVQQQRKQYAQKLLASGNFEAAVAASEFDPQAFGPFTGKLRALAATEPNQLLTAETLTSESPELVPLIDSLLYESSDDTTVALVFLNGLASDPAGSPEAARASISAALAPISGAQFIDLKNASMTLVSDYRQRVFRLLGTALMAITALLLISTRHPARVLWLLGTVAGAVATSLTVGSLLLGGLSLFDVIALALVAGLGLDYALFFSRPQTSAAAASITERAITLCALSSFLVFSILSLSNVPLLRGLGITVASGVAAAYLLARLGRRTQAPTDTNN